jgi:hypothetical protein
MGKKAFSLHWVASSWELWVKGLDQRRCMSSLSGGRTLETSSLIASKLAAVGGHGLVLNAFPKGLRALGMCTQERKLV